MKTALLALAFVLAAARAGHAATLDIGVKDAAGTPVEDAVAWVIPKAGQAPARKPPAPRVAPK